MKRLMSLVTGVLLIVPAPATPTNGRSRYPWSILEKVPREGCESIQKRLDCRRWRERESEEKAARKGA
jgi:hypothetical protein